MDEMKRRPEILAPVGGKEQLLAAVRCGANAVYFGMSDFNARRNADNFADEELENTIAYCHRSNVLVNITFNTLLKDTELSAAKAAIDRAASAGTDAFIVQDLAVAAYIKKHWPDVALHASTQAAAHNSAGVRKLLDMGFSRVVLARELSLAEMRKIYEETGAELEVFVHGAHCMSVSGNCYMSALIGGRSGNRGLCAQPCRLDWRIGDADHVLSLKDLSYITHINELAEAGMASLKIEGRMKRPEYVAAAVTACRDALEGRSPDLETLRAVFSRSGFTDGYYTGKRNASMFGYRTKEDVVAANDVFEDLQRLYSKDEAKQAVDMVLSAHSGVPAELKASCGGESVTVSGEIPQTAKTMPISIEYARRSLSKTGGTAFELSDLQLEADEGLMLPSSALNDLRRRALEELDAKLISERFPAHRKHDSIDARLSCYKAPRHPQFRYRFETAEQCFYPENGIVILPAGEIAAHPKLAERLQGRLYAELPAYIWPEDGDEVAGTLKTLKGLGIEDAVCENIGAVQLAADSGFKLHGGAYLNILNSEALDEYRRLGLEDATLSFELSFALARKLEGDLKRGFIGYGYLPLMNFRNCPARANIGCAECKGESCLKDRKDESFRLLCKDKKYTQLLNCVPLYAGDRSLPPVNFETLYFTTEPRQEAERIASLYRSRSALDGRRTAGLYFRELL